MNVSVTITPALKRDLPSVLRLYGVADIDDGAILPLPMAEALYRKMRSYPEYRIYLARYRGRVVGTFALAIMDNLAHMGRPSGLVEDVVVAEDMRSKGIGRKMMEYAMEICRRKGCYKMSLSSNRRRKDAHRFYRNLGFDQHGISFSIALRQELPYIGYNSRRNHQ